MRRYHFFLETSTDTFKDEDGEVLPDDVAAHAAAVQTAEELWDSRWNDGAIVVREETGRFVSEVPLKTTAAN